MAAFFNQATLTYNGTSATSDIINGELLDVLMLTKTALEDNHATCIINILNKRTTNLNDITLTDDLGSYTLDQQTLAPLSFVTGSIRYFINGVLQHTPTIAAEAPLKIGGISIPAGGIAVVVYETRTSQHSTPTINDRTISISVVSDYSIVIPVCASEPD